MIVRTSLFSFAMVLALAAGASHAQVHKCVDAAGKVSYSETPCGAAAKQSQQMMGREATSTYDPYAHQRTMQSYQRDSAINRAYAPQLDARGDAGGGIVDASRTGGTQPRSASAPQYDDQSQTQSTRKGPIGGSRDVNPNWSPRRGYYGGGGPADQKYEAEQEGNQRLPGRGAAFPKTLSRCDGSYCYDTTGGSYLRNGDGTLLKSGGGVCRQTPGLPGQFTCN